MTQIALENMKLHLGVPADDPGHDLLIAGYVDAAEDHVLRHLRRDLDEEFPEGWPPSVLQAIRLLVAHWYSNREAVAPGVMAEVPYGVKAMLAPYREFGA
ncbi:head-tail connector protein [Epibacterium sp. Ofav1-8]|uniref:head-tail connector protein n=1 Tax=Epibacterium sp. Ofav1-8 TaxID=2917735 RepID=UPI001EF40A19|nr:head-tail connector protein [Epibacterium sp. Ofav1-8]MCG7626049.1 head-tail connector protein [Epibacterium sp. Ofav1-8]